MPTRREGSNGWRSGKDPVQRPLRVVATLVCMGVFAYIAITLSNNPTANPTTVIPTIALALAAALLLLGYDGIVLPGIKFRDTKEEEEEEKKPDD